MPFLRSVSRRGAALAQLLLFVFSLSTSLMPCSDVRAAGVTAHHTSPTSASHEVSQHASHELSHVPAQVMSHDLAPAETPPSKAPTAPDNDMSCPLMIGCSGIAQFADGLEWYIVVSSTPTDAPNGLVLARATVDLDVDSPPPRR